MAVLPLLLVLGAAHAGALSAGALVGVGMDLPAVDPLESTRFGVGPVVVVPLRWSGPHGAGIRASLELGGAPGQDVLYWSETDAGQTSFYAGTPDSAGYASVRALLGPEFAFLPEKPVTPFAGAGVGGGGVATFHSVSGDMAVLQDPAGGGMQTWTLQPTWAAGGWLGVRSGRPGKLALEGEVGYTVSFLPEAPLRHAAAALEPTRSAWSLDLARVSLGVSFPL